jgi:hypothetical protein
VVREREKRERKKATDRLDQATVYDRRVGAATNSGPRAERHWHAATVG